jgi:tRNA(Ile)-lysidine synthase
MLKSVQRTIQNYNLITPNDHILVALSGGCDSCSLLHMLYNSSSLYSIQVSAIHIHHGLRGQDADNDASFCKSLCESLSIPFYTKKYNIQEHAKNQGITIEEAGRNLRYQTFSEVAEQIGANKIATGHNLNDTAETIIFNLTRGTGLKGLCGIPAKRNNIIRPLIGTSRNKLEKYCTQNNITYVTDQTNHTTVYTRNKIRLNVVPILNTINPNFINTQAEAAKIFSQEEDYLTSQAHIAYTKCVSTTDGNVTIDIPTFLTNHSTIQQRILRNAVSVLYEGLQNITHSHIQSLIDLCINQTGRSISLPNGVTAKKSYYNLLIYKNINQQPITNSIQNLTLESFIYLPEINMHISCSKQKIFKKNFTNTCTIYFNYDKIQNRLILRKREAGDTVFLKGVGHQKLKKFFINNKIPQQERELPIVTDGNNVVYVFNHYISPHYKATSDSTNTICIQLWSE